MGPLFCRDLQQEETESEKITSTRKQRQGEHSQHDKHRHNTLGTQHTQLGMTRVEKKPQLSRGPIRFVQNSKDLGTEKTAITTTALSCPPPLWQKHTDKHSTSLSRQKG